MTLTPCHLSFSSCLASNTVFHQSHGWPPNPGVMAPDKSIMKSLQTRANSDVRNEVGWGVEVGAKAVLVP